MSEAVLQCEVDATVVEELPRALYRLELADRSQVLAHAGGKSEADFLRLLPGDRVRVRLSPRDKGRGRITKRYQK